MLNFDEEIANFKPALQAIDVEKVIEKDPMADLTDIMKEMLDKAQQDKE